MPPVGLRPTVKLATFLPLATSGHFPSGHCLNMWTNDWSSERTMSIVANAFPCFSKSYDLEQAWIKLQNEYEYIFSVILGINFCGCFGLNFRALVYGWPWNLDTQISHAVMVIWYPPITHMVPWVTRSPGKMITEAAQNVDSKMRGKMVTPSGGRTWKFYTFGTVADCWRLYAISDWPHCYSSSEINHIHVVDVHQVFQTLCLSFFAYIAARGRRKKQTTARASLTNSRSVISLLRTDLRYLSWHHNLVWLFPLLLEYIYY